MNFNKHFHLVGQHARLSASKYHWIGYDDDKFDQWFLTAMAAQRGTELHALAHELIRLGVKLPNSRKTLNMYVNDALGYRMTPEQPLFYSPNCFGTPDAISLRRNVLRISDLKTGINRASIKQLLVYAAMFCLEYGFKPHELDLIELRIYQNDEVDLYEADPDDVLRIMDRIVVLDKRIESLKEEAGR